uniref:Uncharacterized protein n=1 Tax=Cucumis melo TaxID=3656 RepID=A0A9I9DXQ2_CUCME
MSAISRLVRPNSVSQKAKESSLREALNALPAERGGWATWQRRKCHLYTSRYPLPEVGFCRKEGKERLQCFCSGWIEDDKKEKGRKQSLMPQPSLQRAALGNG